MMERQNRRQFLKQLGLGGAAVVTAPKLMGVAHAAGVDEKTILRKKIEHVVIIFQENRSFDHYFGTFHAKKWSKSC
jgi:Phospholipase C